MAVENKDLITVEQFTNLRKSLKLSQPDFAGWLGYVQSRQSLATTIMKFEKGHERIPTQIQINCFLYLQENPVCQS